MTIHVHFAAGKHYGYQFDAAGAVTATKPYTLSRNSGASADARGPLPGRPGTWLHMVNGVWAGYYIHESAVTDSAAVPEAPLPPPVVVPPAGKPWDQYGATFKKDFSDGTLAPFRVLTYPDDHIGGSGQYMTQFTRYSNGAQQSSVHDGYLDLRCSKRADGLWDGVLVGTSQDGSGQTFGYGIFRAWLRFPIGPGTWQASWLYDTTTWTAEEIDFPEMLEGQSLTAHKLGAGAGAKYGIAKPADLATAFHEFRIERRAGFVAFAIDGTEVGRITAPQPPKQLAILLDSKVGFGWMGGTGEITSSTPNPTTLHVAAYTVDA